MRPDAPNSAAAMAYCFNPPVPSQHGPPLAALNGSWSACSCGTPARSRVVGEHYYHRKMAQPGDGVIIESIAALTVVVVWLPPGGHACSPLTSRRIINKLARVKKDAVSGARLPDVALLVTRGSDASPNNIKDCGAMIGAEIRCWVPTSRPFCDAAASQVRPGFA